MFKQELFGEQASKKYSDYFFDKYLAKECSAEEDKLFEESLLKDLNLKIRFDEFKLEDQKFDNLVPDIKLLLNTKNKTSSTSFMDMFRQWWLKGGVAVLTVSACLFLVLQVTPEKNKQQGVRFKGEGAHFLSFYLQSDSDSEIMIGEDGMKVYPNDRLQFVIHATEKSYVAVFSKDSLDVVSRYAPRAEKMPQVQGEYRFKSSMTLDENLGKESFLALKCTQIHNLQELRKSLEKNWLKVPDDCIFDVVNVKKHARK